jgi:RNA polymerase sigma-70 factor (ECF subfamily)
LAIKTTPTYTDEDLTDLLKEGDRKAFDEFYNRYSKKLLLFAIKKVGDKIIAEDLVQDLFISRNCQAR